MYSLQNAFPWGCLVLRRLIVPTFACFVLILGLCPRQVSAQVSQKPAAFGIPQAPPLVGDTTALALEAQNWLVDLVKINTTNPPGNEQAAAKYIAAVLAKEGIPA